MLGMKRLSEGGAVGLERAQESQVFRPGSKSTWSYQKYSLPSSSSISLGACNVTGFPLVGSIPN